MTWHRVSGLATKVRLPLASGVTVAALAVLTACGSNATGPQTSQFRVLLTDAPSAMLDTADVWISRVYLEGGGGSQPDTANADSTATDTAAAGRVDLYNDPSKPLEYDLLTLQDSVKADVTGLIPVDAGTYQGLLFVVDSARVVLKSGYTFQNGTDSAVLKVPSGATNGIKVKLSDIIAANAGQTTTVTVDLNVDSNFVIQMNQQTGQVQQILFTPVLTEQSRQVEPS